MSNFIKRIVEYLIIIILCFIISSFVFAVEVQPYEEYFDNQMTINRELVNAVELLARKIEQMENMRGI